MKHLFIVFFLTLGLLSGLSAQGTWTLEACIDHALKQNISLQQNELSRENQRISLDRAKSQRLPGLYASGSANSSFGQSMNNRGYYEFGNAQSYSASLSASLSLFSGFQVSNTIKAQELNLLASIEDLKKAKENLSVTIASAYLQVLFNKELLQLAKDQQKLTALQLERYKSMAELGKIPEGQVAEIRAQHANDKVTTTQSESNLRMALLDLAQLIELDDWDQFDIVVPAIDIDALGLHLSPAGEVFASALSTKPAIKASELRLKTSEKELKVAEGGYYPSLSLGANYGNGYYGGNQSLSDQLKNNARTSIGLSLSIPIFNRFNTSNAVKSAKLGIRNAELDVENTKKSLYKEIQQAWYNANNALVKYSASQESVDQTTIAFRFTEEKFNNGRSTSYEYNEARTKLASSISNLLQAKYNYLFSVKILDFYQGDPLRL